MDEAATAAHPDSVAHSRSHSAAHPGFGGLRSAPPPEAWDDWVEFNAGAWPDRIERRYSLIPTVCFNCEAACGLLAYIDKETRQLRRLEGHPLHPASRGRNCPKGPATLSQVRNPDRILHPLRRKGERGEGKWEQVSWEEALDDIAARIRAAIAAERRDAVVYHVGRPGEDLYTERVLSAWGVDGHNSHTNVCSAGARTGYAFWMGYDRPSPDHTHARFILLFSAHLESGHYFNPHAQRLIEAKERGTKIAVVDTRLSNTAARADYWLSPHPGTEAGLLLAIAAQLIRRGQINRLFLERWVNWRETLENRMALGELQRLGFLSRLPAGTSFADFLRLLEDLYAPYTPEWAEGETGVPAVQIAAIADEIAAAGTAFAAHIWRNAAAGNLGGWMVARCLFFLSVLTGAVGTRGGTLPNGSVKYVPKPFSEPAPIQAWNDLHWPIAFPLAHNELSFLLPHMLKEQPQRTIEVYFTRVYNPVWTNPDGFTWIDLLRSGQIGLHVALTPVWCETAQYADYVLPMGMATERHDLHSYETHAAQWIGFRQPVMRAYRERLGQKVVSTRDVNPGQVWEENEFWIDLSWRIDPDGSLGIRRYFESPYRPGEKITVDEYYRWIFENSVPGLPEAAQAQGLDPLSYMRRYGAFEISRDVYEEHERPLPQEWVEQSEVDGSGVWVREKPHSLNVRPRTGPFRDEAGRFRAGLVKDGRPVFGFPTPSGLLEFCSQTLADWGWPESAVPIYPRTHEQRVGMPHLVSQVHPARLRPEAGEFALMPTFRLPTLIHTRTNGAKWLYEISHVNPIWLNPQDAARLGVATDDLVRVETAIGYFVDRVWVTEAIRPGTVACSHHLGRWRLQEDHGSDRWNSALVAIAEDGPRRRMRPVHGAGPLASDDPDSGRIWWQEAGVHQNLLFPVQPDPVSGQHCWHQKVRVRRAAADERYGEIVVDTDRSMGVYRQWMALTRPGPGPDGTRRPYWLMRPLKPTLAAFRMTEASG